jgi:ketosteroid isomerase-like protein
MAMEPAAVVRNAWAAYSTGDVEGALRHFAPDAEWHVADDSPGPPIYRGHDELRMLLDTGSRFSLYSMSVTGISDMGGFVLAHGAVYAEEAGSTVIDRVTIWRCRVEGDVIISVRAEALPASARWQEPRRTAFEG